MSWHLQDSTDSKLKTRIQHMNCGNLIPLSFMSKPTTQDSNEAPSRNAAFGVVINDLQISTVGHWLSFYNLTVIGI